MPQAKGGGMFGRIVDQVYKRVGGAGLLGIPFVSLTLEKAPTRPEGRWFTPPGGRPYSINGSGWYILGLALTRKQPFVTFSYLTPLFAPLKGSSSPLSSSFQAASRGVLGQTKKYFFGAALWPCI